MRRMEIGWRVEPADIQTARQTDGHTDGDSAMPLADEWRQMCALAVAAARLALASVIRFASRRISLLTPAISVGKL